MSHQVAAPATVVVRLRGGLGNQMFQWATAHAMARRCNAEVALDLREQPAGGAQAHLLRWQVPARPLQRSLAWRYNRPALLMARRQPWAARLLGFHVERSLRHDASLQRRRLPVLLDGYYQSERYFSDARTALCAHFVPRSALSPRQQALALSVAQGVAVHVRRGDFAGHGAAAAVHGCCEPAYYAAAAQLVMAQTGLQRFFVFSDDALWARSALRLPGEVQVIDGHADAPEIDVHLMSFARHHICANSSFSWWGAWLGSHPRQLVVAPRRWFASPALDASDIVPPHWARL
jgi:hypothetical protein